MRERGHPAEHVRLPRVGFDAKGLDNERDGLLAPLANRRPQLEDVSHDDPPRSAGGGEHLLERHGAQATTARFALASLSWVLIVVSFATVDRSAWRRGNPYRILVWFCGSTILALWAATALTDFLVRTRGNDAALARAASMRDRWDRATLDWLSRPIAGWPYPAGRVEGTRAFARFLATVRSDESAVMVYTKLLELGISAQDEIDVRLLLLRPFVATGRLEQAREQSRRILAIDPHNAEARTLRQ